MTLTIRTSGDVFYEWCRRNLPPFIFESFKSDEMRLTEMFTAWESVWQNLYGSLDTLMEELDVDTATSEHLYYLGRQLGVEELEFLPKYLNADGSINTTLISESDYNLLVAKQRVTIKFCLFRYLMKGTPESLVRYLYEKDFPSEVIEKWFTSLLGPTSGSDPWPTSATDLPEDILKYGVPIWDLPSGYLFYQAPYDLYTEIITDLPSMSGTVAYWVNNPQTNPSFPSEKKSWIRQLIDSDYGYRYLITDDSTFLYRTPVTMNGSLYQPHQWYLSSQRFGVDGIIYKMDTVDSRIIVQTDMNNLSILDRQQELNDSGEQRPLFTIDNEDCLSFFLFDSKQKLLLDRNTYFEIRDIETYQQIQSKINKPAGFTGVIQDIAYVANTNNGSYYFIASDTNKGILIRITTLGDIDIVSSVHNLPCQALNRNWSIYSTEEWNITISECLVDYSVPYEQYLSKFHFLNFAEGIDIMNAATVNHGITQRHTARVRIGDSITISTYQDTFHIFDLITRRLFTSTADLANGGLKMYNMWPLDKIFISGSETTIYPVTEIYEIPGFNSFRSTELYKSHHIDIRINVAESRILTTISDIKSWVNANIKWVKPAHVVLDSVQTTIEGAEVLKEYASVSDAESFSPLGSGGSEYHMSMYAHYDGTHPYKRDTDPHPLYNDNNGVGSPLLYYTENVFTFSGVTPASAFDDLVFNNIPLTE